MATRRALGRVNGLVAVLCVLATGACGRPANRADARLPRVSPAALPPRVPLRATDADSGPAPQFDPHWTCRITGPGRPGHRPDVSVATRPFHADPRAIYDAIPLTEHVLLERHPLATPDGGNAFDRAISNLRRAAIPDVSRSFDTRAHTVELLFEERGMLVSGDAAPPRVDASKMGVAFWDGSRIVALPVDGSPERVLVDAVTTLERPCAAPPTDPMRLVPMEPRAMPFPQISGMPPSTADARWTLARDASGVCIARLEGDGAWGRVAVEASARGMRGDVYLSETLYPVMCAPAQ